MGDEGVQEVHFSALLGEKLHLHVYNNLADPPANLSELSELVNLLKLVKLLDFLKSHRQHPEQPSPSQL